MFADGDGYPEGLFNDKKYTNLPPIDSFDKYHVCPFCSRDVQYLKAHIGQHNKSDKDAIAKFKELIESLLKLNDEVRTMRHYLEGKGFLNNYNESEFDKYSAIISKFE